MSKTGSTDTRWMRAGALAGFRDVARELGHAAEPAVLRQGLPVAMLDDPELRVPYTAVCRLMEACADEWSCSDFGLRVGQTQSLSLLGPIGLVARLTHTVGEALKALAENMNVHSTAFEMSVRLDADPRIAAAIYAPRPQSGAGRQKLEMSMAAVRNVLALVSGQPGFAPVAVHLACVAPRDTGPQRRFFRSPVHYNADETALLFRADMLALPTAIRDPAIAPLVQRYLAELPAQFGDDIIATTCSLVGTLLSSGRCTREAVAECLNLHPRTYQRRLKARGTSFSRLLDEHRHALALELLGRGSLSLAQVADTLGFADQSAFNQAFRRWTDNTPGAVARALGRRQRHPVQKAPGPRAHGR